MCAAFIETIAEVAVYAAIIFCAVAVASRRQPMARFTNRKETRHE